MFTRWSFGVLLWEIETGGKNSNLKLFIRRLILVAVVVAVFFLQASLSP